MKKGGLCYTEKEDNKTRLFKKNKKKKNHNKVTATKTYSH